MIYGRGLLGLLLMKCGLTYKEAQDLLDLLETRTAELDFEVTVERFDD